MASEEDVQKQWLKRLGKGLDTQQSSIALHNDYYAGKQKLAFATPKFRQEFGELFATIADNFCAVIVDSVEERLNVQGFRIPTQQATKNPNGQYEGDTDAWRIWQANHLDADSQLGHTESLVTGVSHALVWSGEDPETPEITIESPTNMVVAYGTDRRRPLAALKRWRDDEQKKVFATLYLPDAIYKYQADRLGTTQEGSTSTYTSVQWKRRELDTEEWPLANPLGRVPIVSFVNRARLDGKGRSEIEDVISIQNAINKEVADMLTASEFSAFVQRYFTGITIPKDPNTGKPIEPFKIGADRLLMVKDKDARAGQFEASDLENYVKAIEMLVQHLASRTRTPPHYFMAGMGSFPSGESLRAAEAGLVSKVRRKQRHWGEGWEEVIRLAFQVLGDPRAAVIDSETIWRDPETRTEAEHVDALIKMASIGVPHEALWERWGATPQEIARWKEMAKEQPQPVQMVTVAPAPTNGTPR